MLSMKWAPIASAAITGRPIISDTRSTKRSFSATSWGDADASANSTVPRWTGTMNKSEEIIHVT